MSAEGNSGNWKKLFTPANNMMQTEANLQGIFLFHSVYPKSDPGKHGFYNFKNKVLQLDANFKN